VGKKFLLENGINCELAGRDKKERRGLREREREREKELEGEKERAREEGRFAHPKLPSDKATKPHCTFLLRQLGLSDKDVAAFEGRRNKK
jgi:hypothetical protein